jgi:hypothetical protein
VFVILDSSLESRSLHGKTILEGTGYCLIPVIRNLFVCDHSMIRLQDIDIIYLGNCKNDRKWHLVLVSIPVQDISLPKPHHISCGQYLIQLSCNTASACSAMSVDANSLVGLNRIRAASKATFPCSSQQICSLGKSSLVLCKLLFLPD